MTLAGGVLLDVVGGALRGGGVPVGLVACPHLLVRGGLMHLVARGLARTERQRQRDTKEKNNRFPIFFIRNHYLQI